MTETSSNNLDAPPLSGRIQDLSPVGVSETVPAAARDEILRENLLDSLEVILSGDTRIVAVEGTDGAGKTTLMAQFARRHRRECICLFVNAGNRYASHPSQLIYDLCNQLEVVLTGAPLPDFVDRSEDELRSKFNQLHRQLIRNGRMMYVLVDGLEDIPSDDEASLRAIMDLLPISLQRFRFVTSGSVQTLRLDDRTKSSAQPFRIPYFSRTETQQYFEGLELLRETVDEIHNACRGMPGYLAAIRSQVVREGAEGLRVDDLPTSLERLIARHWNDVHLGERQRQILALIAHGRRPFSVAEVAQLIETDPSEVEVNLGALDFVQLPDGRVDDIRFRSEYFRRFASVQLEDLKEWVHDKVINLLQQDPNGVEAISTLPQQYLAAERFSDLVEYFSGERIAAILEKSPSVKLLQQQAAIGIAATQRLGRDSDFVRLTFQKSTITSIVESDIGRAEIRALAALGDVGAALALAQGATRDEDKLMLYAAVSRALRDQGLQADDALTQQIREIHERVDYSAMSQARAEEIAADLAHAHIDLAIEAVSRAAKAHGSNRIDWAFAKLAVRTSVAGAFQEGSVEPTRQILERIKDPLARRLSSEAMLVMGNTTADAAILEAERLESVGDQLYLLRQWVQVNRDRTDAQRVTMFALQRAIMTSDYSANATVFRELSAALPYIPDAERAREVLSLLDAQLPTIQSIGPTDDCVRLMLLMARAEQRHRPTAVLDRLLSTYYYISEIAEYATRTACMARLLAWLSKIDPERQLEIAEGMHTLVHADFEKELRQLLGDSAAHDEATGGIIKALSWLRPDLALNVAQQLNTETRRDVAYSDIVEVLSDVPLSELPIGQVLVAIDRILAPEVRDEAVFNLLERVCRKVCPDESLAEVSKLIWLAPSIRSAVRRAEACAGAQRFCARNPTVASSLRERLAVETRAAWAAIDASWVRLGVGFGIVADLARELPAEARALAAEVQAFRETEGRCDEGAALAAVYSLRLAVRAYAGLLPKRHDRPEDLSRIRMAIQSISSVGVQIELWADLVLRLKLGDRLSDCQKIVDNDLRNLFGLLGESDLQNRARLTILAAPAMYAAYPHSLVEWLRDLPVQERDEAYAWVALFLLRSKSVFDPFEQPGADGFAITYNRAIEVCNVIGHIEQDSRLYALMCDVIDSANGTKVPARLTRLQKQDVARVLRAIVEARLPSRRFIVHRGYVIAAHAQINRLLQHPDPSWETLIASAQEIPNGADRAYVLGIIAATAYRNDKNKRNDVLALAESIVETIPTLVDRMQHYHSLGQLLNGVDNIVSRNYFREAMRVSLQGREQSVADARRATIDMAYRIDPEFATALASELNDDPARRSVERRIGMHELKRSLASRTQSVAEEKATDEEFSRAAWMRLGALVAQRSDNVAPDRVNRYLDVASRQSMEIAYPIYAWATENAISRFAHTGEVARFVYPLFDAAMLSAELALRSASRPSRRVASPGIVSNIDGGMSTFVVESGERTDAIVFVEDWLRRYLGTVVKVCDPYFSPADVEMLRVIRRVRPECQILILTSGSVHAERKVERPLEATYRSSWRAASDDPEPSVEIVIASLRGNGGSPIHDRWWISGKSGLEFGTSWNGLGLEKTSTIRSMGEEEVLLKEQKLDDFLLRKASIATGARVAYETVLLGED